MRGVMLLTLTTTRKPALDLGYLLHKNPARCQAFAPGTCIFDRHGIAATRCVEHPPFRLAFAEGDGQISVDEGAHFVAKAQLSRRVTKVHPAPSCTASTLTWPSAATYRQRDCHQCTSAPSLDKAQQMRVDAPVIP